MAIAQQLQALSPEDLVPFPRSTDDYIPKAHSKLPFNFAAVSWDMVDSDHFRQLSGEAIKLYVYLARHVDLRLKQKTRGNGEYLLGRTFAKKYETIASGGELVACQPRPWPGRGGFLLCCSPSARTAPPAPRRRQMA